MSARPDSLLPDSSQSDSSQSDSSQPEAVSPPIESIDRALLILSALADAGPGGITLAELAAQTTLNKATAHRALASLKFRAFATQDVLTGKYALGGEAALLGDRFYGQDNLASLLRPALTSLSAEVGELVHLGVLDGTYVVYLSKVEPERAVRVFSQVGARVPAHATAMGRAILAGMGVSGTQTKLFIPSTSQRFDQEVTNLAAEVAGAHVRGYACEIEENEPGIACVSLPIFRGTQVIAAVSVTAPAPRMTKDRMAQVAATIQRVLDAELPGQLRAGLIR